MRPEQLYHSVCLTCHGPDGSGKMYARAAVRTIPDLTDAKWQAKRTDAELQHTILEGKERSSPEKSRPQPMVSQKVNLERAQIDVKDMVALHAGLQGREAGGNR